MTEITAIEVQVDAPPTVVEVAVAGAQGPQGDQGIQGIQGIQGERGLPGTQYGNVDGGSAAVVFVEIQNLDGEGA